MTKLIHLLTPVDGSFFVKDKSFLEEGRLQFTFHQTMQMTSALGKLLQSYLSIGDRVALFLSRGLKATIAIYATLYIGAIYVPINTIGPIKRVLFLLANTAPKLIIGQGDKPPWAKDFIWLDIDSCGLHTMRELWITPAQETEALAAILHTSGSTGNPKGVALSYRAIIAFCDWAGKTFSISHLDTIANLAPFCFDLSLFDLFTSFRFGSRLLFMPQHLTLHPLAMTDWLIANKVTIWYTVPTVLAFLLKRGNIEKLKYAHLRCILFAGEPIATYILLSLVTSLPNIAFYNLYGPLETNVCCYWKVDADILKRINQVPIGFPACNDRLKLDDSSGELWVEGPSLMSGYWINGLQSHKEWYRTGDLVDKLEDGSLVYKGRMDRMFKYKGFRIESYEIENSLLSIPEIEAAVVCLVEENIVACLVVKIDISSQELNKVLEASLPSYMIPSKILFFNVFPKLPNGKTDLLKVQHEAYQQCIHKK